MILELNDERPLKIAIMASGRGSNAEALMKYAYHNPGDVHITCLVSNRENASVLEKAQRFDIPSFSVKEDSSSPDPRLKQEQEMLAILQEHRPNWLLLAGYLRVLSSDFLQHFYDENLKIYRVINIHPSLLPKYPGLRAYERAFSAGEKEGGVSVHLVGTEVDSGPLLRQRSFPRLPSDTLESFMLRGLQVEHELYVDVLKNLVNGKLEVIKG